MNATPEQVTETMLTAAMEPAPSLTTEAVLCWLANAPEAALVEIYQLACLKVVPLLRAKAEALGQTPDLAGAAEVQKLEAAKLSLQIWNLADQARSNAMALDLALRYCIEERHDIDGFRPAPLFEVIEESLDQIRDLANQVGAL